MVWFVAGSAAGVYATSKARRAAYRLSAPGLIDQAAALGSGWRAFSAEVRAGMNTREHEIVHQLSGATLDHPDLLRLQAERTDKDRT